MESGRAARPNGHDYVLRSSKMVIPKWAARVLEGLENHALFDTIGSWDEAFGKPNGKPCPFKPGRHTRHTEQMIRRGKGIIDRVGDSIWFASQHGRAIDDKLFDEIGREEGIGGKTEVKKMWKLYREAEEARKRRK